MQVPKSHFRAAIVRFSSKRKYPPNEQLEVFVKTFTSVVPVVLLFILGVLSKRMVSYYKPDESF